MKIKMLCDMGAFRAGDIVDAGVSPDGDAAYAFDKNGSGWYLTKGHSFQVLDSSISAADESEDKGRRIGTINDLFAQDLSELTVRFK